MMQKSGFTTIYEMPGMIAWNSANKPVETVESVVGPKVKGLTETEYLETVKSDKYVLVDFNAVWCGPCKKLTPILDKIDADENPELLQSKGIEGIPYLELYKDGKLVWSYKGFISESEILAQTKL
jgi:thioredoxin-like negative regulator of GroEL